MKRLSIYSILFLLLSILLISNCKPAGQEWRWKIEGHKNGHKTIWYAYDININKHNITYQNSNNSIVIIDFPVKITDRLKDTTITLQ